MGSAIWSYGTKTRCPFSLNPGLKQAAQDQNTLPDLVLGLNQVSLFRTVGRKRAARFGPRTIMGQDKFGRDKARTQFIQMEDNDHYDR